jgi:hypothetical protein
LPIRNGGATGGLSISGEERTSTCLAANGAFDPKRRFATTDYRIAKGSLAFLLAASVERTSTLHHKY